MIEEFINNYYISRILFCIVMTIIAIAVAKSINTKFKLNLKPKLSFKQLNAFLIVGYILITLGSILLIEQLIYYISKYIEVGFTSVIEPTNLLMVSISFITTCMFAPITEEIVFRFGLLEYMKRKINSKVALILTSILFALLHFYNIDGLIITFILGLIFGISYLKTNNLLYPIIIHFGYNLYALFGNYLVLNNVYELCIGIIFTIIGILLFLKQQKTLAKSKCN